jgi:hypothetical protein
MTVTNRKIDGKIVYFEIGPSGVQVEIDKKEYDKKLSEQIKDFKSSQKKARGGTVTKKAKTKAKVAGRLAKRGYGISR